MPPTYQLCDLNDSHDDLHSEVPAYKCITLGLCGSEDFER